MDRWMDREPRISVMIPYANDKRLSFAYNRAMEEANSEWVLFLDQDIFLCNPHWYVMCQNAIRQLTLASPLPGWITCVTNRIGAPQQREDEAPKGHDISEHCLYAKTLYEKYGDHVCRIPGALSGFFILTNKTAWKAAGGFDETKQFLGVDNRYSRAVVRAGFGLYYMPGLYVYHIYKEKNRFMRW